MVSTGTGVPLGQRQRREWKTEWEYRGGQSGWSKKGGQQGGLSDEKGGKNDSKLSMDHPLLCFRTALLQETKEKGDSRRIHERVVEQFVQFLVLVPRILKESVEGVRLMPQERVPMHGMLKELVGARVYRSMEQIVGLLAPQVVEENLERISERIVEQTTDVPAPQDMKRRPLKLQV